MTSQRRIRWKLFAPLITLLVMGTAACWFFLGKLREPFVSKVIMGYRYRCTLSTEWKLTEATSKPLPNPSEEYEFSPAPSPIREWMAIHLLQQSLRKRSSKSSSLPMLDLTTEVGRAMPHTKIISGYPEVETRAPERRFQIDGCPATLTHFNLRALGMDVTYHVLLVCTPNSTHTYCVNFMTNSKDSPKASRELESVIASFHVEKVAEAGGK